MILFGEASLWHVLSNYAHHFHNERNHQGKANVILFPAPADRIGESFGEIRTRERLESGRRSEEHTSELQSRQYLVCRLLLEKKKKTHKSRRATARARRRQVEESSVRSWRATRWTHPGNPPPPRCPPEFLALIGKPSTLNELQ